VYSVKVVARPDPQMVEVPLEIDAELPREFEGNALLSASGLPRKVHLKAERDQLKLSTAYRADQLVADIVRVALRAAPAEVERAQAAARAFLRAVRERRPDGATLLVESSGDGKVDVKESGAGEKPREPPRPPQRGPSPPDVLRRLEARVAALETRLSALEDRPPATPLEPREAKRASFPRERAIDAFAERLRAELRKSIEAPLEASVLLDRASAAQPGDTGASARVETLRRLLEEIDLYPASDLPLAEALVARLARETSPAELPKP
jgi:hypothetical protein